MKSFLWILAVCAAPAFGQLTITNNSPLPNGMVNRDYTFSFTTTGGVGNVTFGLPVGQTLPAFLSLSTSGTLSGLPVTPVANHTFSVTATDSSSNSQTKPFSITIVPKLELSPLTLPNGTAGVTYQQAITATGGTPPYQFNATGLPQGLSMNSTGVITGIPASSAAASNVQVTVVDSSSPAFTASNNYSLTINAGSGLTITTASPLPGATISRPYSQQLLATGGTGSITWALAPTSAPLPTGLNLSSAGLVSGTPSGTPGTANVTVRATDSATQFTDKAFVLTVNAVPAITTSSLPAGVVGTAYNASLAVSGGTAPFTWTITSGALPQGLTFNAGTITGTPTASGNPTIGFQATDANRAIATVQLPLNITSGPGAFSITTTTLPNWTAGINYNQTLLTSGGTSPFAWAVTVGSLPPGITLGQLSGTLSGVPTTPGTYTFTIQATEAGTAVAARAFTVTINNAPTLGPTTLANGVLNTAYSSAVAPSGGTAPFTYAVTQGALPGGLTLSASSGAISGTPSAAGNFTFTITATDFAGAIATRQYTVSIASSVLTVSTTSLSNAVVNISYSAQLQASGGSPPYTFSITSGSLPAGLTLAAGTISGTPTATGSSSFTVQVQDSAQNTATRALTLTVVGSGLVVTTQSLPQAVVNTIYTTTLSAAGGSGSGYTWSLAAGSNPLPTGLVLSSSGILSGTATATANTTITVQVTDSVGTVATKQFVFSVVANPLTITTNSPLPDASQGILYTTSFQASGGSGGNYFFSVISGSLPPGVNLSPNGTLTGTPNAAGAYQFTIQVADASGGAATKPFSLSVIAPNLTITTQSLPPGVTGQAYSATVAASGGTQPYTFSLTIGQLPTGLSLNAGTGAITGTPSAQGGFNFIIQVRDANGLTTTASLSIQIVTFAITTDALPNAAIGVPYSVTLGSLGGTPPLTWTVSAGSLPSGIALASTTGTLSGTSNTPGTSTFTIRVQDAGSNVATRQFQLTVTTGLTITTQSLPNGTVGVGYQQTLQGTGGSAPYTWSVISGALPVGLSLNGGTGVISGTPNTTIGSPYQFVIRLRDSAGAQAEKLFTISISGTSGGPAITTASLPNANPGVPYSHALTASGGTAPYSWTIIGGIPPAGFSLSPQGVLTGTASQGQIGQYAITVQVTDAGGQSATKQLTLNVVAVSSLAIGTTSLPNANVGVPYTQVLVASGGSNTGYTWQLSPGSGSLPPGLTLSPTGAISGTPSSAGSFAFTVQVSDSTGATATRQLSISVTSVLTISTTNLPIAVLNTAYPTFTLVAVGGSSSYNWLVIGGSLPQGINLTTSGVLVGTPTAAGTFHFTVRVTDTTTNNTATKDLTLVVQGTVPLSITTESLPTVGISLAYVFSLQATGGQPPYNWSLANGALPQGLTLSPNGLISGTTTAAGTYPITVQVRDNLNVTVQKFFNLTVGLGGLTIVTSTLPTAALNTTYTFTLLAQGGIAPFTWTILSGQLPAGLTLTAGTGTIAGTPTQAGVYTVIFQVADSAGSTASRALTIQVTAGLTIVTAALPNGQSGSAYNQTLSASGGTNTGFTWTITSGSLPQGLSLSAAGVITGTPTVSGSFTFIVQVSDSAGATATRQFTIQIGSGIAITPETLPNGSVGTAYSQPLTATGGSGALQWSVSAGSLPAGITLNSTTGLLSGTPTTAGSSNFTIRVQDASGASATRAYTVVIGEGLTITTPSTLPAASENVSYSQTLAASGGTAPYTWSLSVGSLPPGLTLNTNTGVISGTPSSAGSFSFIVQVRDSRQVSGQKAFTLQVGGRITIATPAALPSAIVRTPYSEALVATGGTPPYTWSLAPGGIPPLGMTVDRDGVLSGTPANAGTFTFTIQVTDSAGSTASRTFTLTVQQSLLITTASPLPAATAGSAYAQALAASGGQAPYTWSLASGTLPAGLALTPAGILSGTPTASGSFSFQIQVADNTRTTATANFTLVVRLPAAPVLTITGLPETITPAQQPRLGINIGAAYPVPITATLTLSFTPDAINPADDPAVAFSSGGRTLNFTIPANATDAQLPAGFAMQTGTVSGEIKLTLTMRAGGNDITPSPAPTVVGRVAKAAPVVRSVTARRVATGLEVVITGFSTTRDITSATFRFSPAPGSSLQTSELTVQLAEGARGWYQSEASRRFGSQFTLTQLFNVQGDTSAIASVSVTLTNTEGTSASSSANF